jgi:hypothetical protein
MVNWLCNFFNCKKKDEEGSEMPHKPVKNTLTSEYRIWLPDAINVTKTLNKKMRTRGEFKDGFPKGIILHWDSGWSISKNISYNPFPKSNKNASSKALKSARHYALSCVDHGIAHGYNYLVMDLFGKVYQSSPLTRYGYHAGKSYWPELGYSVSSKLVGVEIKCPGNVKKLKSGNYITWFKQVWDKNYVRSVEKEANVQKGHYVMFTKEQEDAVIKLCCDLWLCSPIVHDKKLFKIKYILGHDSVAPGRKSDIGGSMSITIPEIQKKVREQLLSYGYKREDLE